MILLLAVLSAAATINISTAPHVHANYALLDNSCQRSIEKANLPLSPLLNSGTDALLFHNLADLPDANEELLVNRTVNGCPAPVIVVHNVSTGRR